MKLSSLVEVLKDIKENHGEDAAITLQTRSGHWVRGHAAIFGGDILHIKEYDTRKYYTHEAFVNIEDITAIRVSLRLHKEEENTARAQPSLGGQW